MSRLYEYLREPAGNLHLVRGAFSFHSLILSLGWEIVKKPYVIVEYKDKKSSSGKVVDGNIHLAISSRLGPQERERHIDELTGKLINKINWAQRYKFEEQQDGPVKSDRDLLRLADTINKAYYNLPLESIAFHRQKSTWGTCSLKTKQVYISHRLIGASLEFLWYVVTHEICHLAEPSHNARFWGLVSKACPGYAETRKRLKAFGLQMWN